MQEGNFLNKRFSGLSVLDRTAEEVLHSNHSIDIKLWKGRAGQGQGQGQGQGHRYGEDRVAT